MLSTTARESVDRGTEIITSRAAQSGNVPNPVTPAGPLPCRDEACGPQRRLGEPTAARRDRAGPNTGGGDRQSDNRVGKQPGCWLALADAGIGRTLANDTVPTRAARSLKERVKIWKARADRAVTKVTPVVQETAANAETLRAYARQARQLELEAAGLRLRAERVGELMLGERRTFGQGRMVGKPRGPRVEIKSAVGRAAEPEVP